MKHRLLAQSLSLIALVVLASAVGLSQEPEPADNSAQQMRNEGPPRDVRVNVIQQLGLSRDQLQQMRRLNMGRKPLVDAGQRRLRQANRALDQAIYADQVSDAEVEVRLKELQMAQAEMAKIRFTHELNVRRVLTPDQLVRFRAIRQQFDQTREPRTGRVDRARPDAASPRERPRALRQMIRDRQTKARP